MAREETEDAVRDGLALLRAAYAGDEQAMDIVAANLPYPGLSAAFLAELLAVFMRSHGTTLDAVDHWQRWATL